MADFGRKPTFPPRHPDLEPGSRFVLGGARRRLVGAEGCGRVIAPPTLMSAKAKTHLPPSPDLVRPRPADRSVIEPASAGIRESGASAPHLSRLRIRHASASTKWPREGADARRGRDRSDGRIAHGEGVEAAARTRPSLLRTKNLRPSARRGCPTSPGLCQRSCHVPTRSSARPASRTRQPARPCSCRHRPPCVARAPACLRGRVGDAPAWRERRSCVAPATPMCRVAIAPPSRPCRLAVAYGPFALGRWPGKHGSCINFVQLVQLRMTGNRSLIDPLTHPDQIKPLAKSVCPR